jgi:dual specificity phosphatase 12
MAGVSRSASVVVAYLMKTQSLTLENALRFVRQYRYIQPNVGFMQQLQLFQMMNYTLEGDSPFHVRYRTQIAAYHRGTSYSTLLTTSRKKEEGFQI